MTRPTFSHPVFEQLYERDYFIDDAVLRDILALGPEVAAPELLKITEAMLDPARQPEIQQQTWFQNYHLLHALYLLHDLRTPAAFDAYRQLLRLRTEDTDYWFGDFLNEEVAIMLGEAGRTRLPELLALLEDSAVSLHHRTVVAAALVWLTGEYPELRPAITEGFRRHLRYIIDNAARIRLLFPPDQDELGYDVKTYLGLLLTELQEGHLAELEPETRTLHRLNLVDKTIGGGEKDIDFNFPARPQLNPDIFTRYEQQRELADNHSPYHPNAAALAEQRAADNARLAKLRQEYWQREYQRPEPYLALPKIGRNDPCTCGSGKKFKKCCGA